MTAKKILSPPKQTTSINNKNGIKVQGAVLQRRIIMLFVQTGSYLAQKCTIIIRLRVAYSLAKIMALVLCIVDVLPLY